MSLRRRQQHAVEQPLLLAAARIEGGQRIRQPQEIRAPFPLGLQRARSPLVCPPACSSIPVSTRSSVVVPAGAAIRPSDDPSSAPYIGRRSRTATVPRSLRSGKSTPCSASVPAAASCTSRAAMACDPRSPKSCRARSATGRDGPRLSTSRWSASPTSADRCRAVGRSGAPRRTPARIPQSCRSTFPQRPRRCRCWPGPRRLRRRPHRPPLRQGRSPARYGRRPPRPSPDIPLVR